MKPSPMIRVYDKLIWDTTKAEIVASNAYFDGKNYEREGTNTFLMRTQNGRFFLQFNNANDGNKSYLKPLSDDEAMTLFHELEVKEKKFNELWEGVTLKDA